MQQVEFPVIDPVATGKNILSLRKEKGLTVKDLQAFFGFEEPQAIYRWQYGKTLPSVDNLYALSSILEVPIARILVRACFENTNKTEEQQEAPAASVFLRFIRKKRLNCMFNDIRPGIRIIRVEQRKIPGQFCYTANTEFGFEKRMLNHEFNDFVHISN